MAEGWTNVCCNPFGKPNHFVRNQRQLRVVKGWMCEKAPTIFEGQKICDSCRKELTKMSSVMETSMACPESDSEPEKDFEPLQFESCESVSVVNTCLETLGETPITKEKLRYKAKSQHKVERITTMIENAILGERKLR